MTTSEVWFYSASAGCVPGYEEDGKQYMLKNLSNFFRVGSILVPLTGLDGVTFTGMFPSVEHAIQAAKYLFLEGEARLDLVARFVVGGEYGLLNGAAVLKKGRRIAMQEMSVALRVKAWDVAMPRIIRTCIEARAAVDAEFVRVCKALVGQGIRIRHYARMRFWRCKKTGALKGVDHVGPVLEDIGAPTLPHE
jgi:hypothetical protein